MIHLKELDPWSAAAAVALLGLVLLSAILGWALTLAWEHVRPASDIMRRRARQVGCMCAVGVLLAMMGLVPLARREGRAIQVTLRLDERGEPRSASVLVKRALPGRGREFTAVLREYGAPDGALRSTKRLGGWRDAEAWGELRAARHAPGCELVASWTKRAEHMERVIQARRIHIARPGPGCEARAYVHERVILHERRMRGSRGLESRPLLSLYDHEVQRWWVDLGDALGDEPLRAIGAVLLDTHLLVVVEQEGRLWIGAHDLASGELLDAWWW